MSKTIRPHTPIDALMLELVEKFDNDPEKLLEMLSELQEPKGYLEREQLQELARATKMPAHKIFGMATFYSMLSTTQKKAGKIRVCDGPACWLQGGEALHQMLHQKYSRHPGWEVERSSCLGLCDHAPAALVNEQQAGPLMPHRLPEDPLDLSLAYIDYSKPRLGELRVMLSRLGKIDPGSLESARQAGEYRALEKILAMSPRSVIDEVEQSGLSGRGGAGFPVGRKWRFVADASRKPKYIICNADESEPLIFKDRILISSDPHQILEGMAIAAYATGAEHGFIYIRGEYAAQAEILEHAIGQAEAAHLLGTRILGSDFSFHIHVHRGAGAYICGEETALIESLEGKRGEPRLRPPYPPTYGYKGYPTLVNNVESFAAVPAIITNGAEWYRSLSNFRTAGTKLFMVLGRVQHPGIFEAPFGITLRQVIEDFGGGMLPGSEFKFALSGGAAGTFVSPAHLDIPIDYQSVKDGVSIGAGAFLICDQRDSPVALLQQLLHFFKVESCGKCTPCRVGTYRCYEILTDLLQGQGTEKKLDELADLGRYMQEASFCGLGQSVAIPIESALRNFLEDFHVQITSKKPAQ